MDRNRDSYIRHNKVFPSSGTNFIIPMPIIIIIILHGQYIRNIDRQLISEENTFLWLSNGDLKAETESEIEAAQDQALQTKYYATKILNAETDSKCRLCQQFDKTIDHIISACPILTK